VQILDLQRPLTTELKGKNGMMRAQEEYQLRYTLDDGF
jgi:hypothetical protein